MPHKCYCGAKVMRKNSDGNAIPPPPPPPPPPLAPPPNVPEMTHLLAQATRYITEVMDNVPCHRDHEEGVGCSMRNFFGHSSPMFEGSHEPMVAGTLILISKSWLKLWVAQMNKKLSIGDLSSRDKH